jgi:hypothetical protein
VERKNKDGTSTEIFCPEVAEYKKMGGVDRFISYEEDRSWETLCKMMAQNIFW